MIISQQIATFLGPIFLLLVGYFFGSKRDKENNLFQIKLKLYADTIVDISKHSYTLRDEREATNKLIELFAPVRLVAGSKVSKEVREYFSLVSEYFEAKEKKDEVTKNKISDKISICSMELEQLMRLDLNQKRTLEKNEILDRHSNNKN